MPQRLRSRAGDTRSYDYAPIAGHILDGNPSSCMSEPDARRALIVRSADDLRADRQRWSDADMFQLRTPEELLAD